MHKIDEIILDIIGKIPKQSDVLSDIFDELDFVEIIMKIENEYNISIDDNFLFLFDKRITYKELLVYLYDKHNIKYLYRKEKLERILKYG